MNNYVNYSLIVILSPVLLYLYGESEKNRKEIKDIIANTNIDRNEMLKEVREKTDKVIENNPKRNSAIINYISGNCWFNSKLSGGSPPLSTDFFVPLDTSNWYELRDYEKDIIKHINESVEYVEPLSYPVTLFHGFEQHTKYNHLRWSVGSIIKMKGFLSKTLSIEVADMFAYRQSTFLPKYLIVHYPPGTKHLSSDIRAHNEEFEYLTKSEEELKITKIVRYYEFPFSLKTFYICDYTK